MSYVVLTHLVEQPIVLGFIPGTKCPGLVPISMTINV